MFFFKEIEFLESMNTVKDVRQILLLKKNLLSDLAELKRRFVTKMTSLKTKHEAQIKLLKKQNPQQKKKRRGTTKYYDRTRHKSWKTCEFKKSLKGFYNTAFIDL